MNMPETLHSLDIDEAQALVEDAFLRRSRENGVKVARDGMISVSQGGISFVAATIEGVAEIPAKALNDGVEFGYVYYSASSPTIPGGYYTLRLQAYVDAVGPVCARAELVGDKGDVVARSEGRVEVSSLTILEDSNALPMIMAQIVFDRDVEPGIAAQASLQLGVWCKKNGMHGDGFTFRALP